MVNKDTYNTSHVVDDKTEHKHWRQAHWNYVTQNFREEVCCHSIVTTRILMPAVKQNQAWFLFAIT